MILTVKKKNKRNRQKYPVISVRCSMGSPTVSVVTVDGRLKLFNRFELEIFDLEVIHKGVHI